jgi:Domain of unknown function (DUF3291)
MMQEVDRSDLGLSSRRYVTVMTFGISHLPKQSPPLVPFYPYVGRVVKAARAAPGFAAVQPDLGPVAHPRFYDSIKENADLEVSQVLFLWDDIEAVVAFSYSGLHKEVLEINRRNGWFVHDNWPAYVAWWDKARSVSWLVGCAKLEQLHDRGSTPSAFNFKYPFAEDGTAYKLDHDRLASYKRRYA